LFGRPKTDWSARLPSPVRPWSGGGKTGLTPAGSPWVCERNRVHGLRLDYFFFFWFARFKEHLSIRFFSFLSPPFGVDVWLQACNLDQARATTSPSLFFWPCRLAFGGGGGYLSYFPPLPFFFPHFFSPPFSPLPPSRNKDWRKHRVAFRSFFFFFFFLSLRGKRSNVLSPFLLGHPPPYRAPQ